jgi:hypothetical protein
MKFSDVKTMDDIHVYITEQEKLKQKMLKLLSQTTSYIKPQIITDDAYELRKEIIGVLSDNGYTKEI